MGRIQDWGRGGGSTRKYSWKLFSVPTTLINHFDCGIKTKTLRWTHKLQSPVQEYEGHIRLTLTKSGDILVYALISILRKYVKVCPKNKQHSTFKSNENPDTLQHTAVTQCFQATSQPVIWLEAAAKGTSISNLLDWTRALAQSVSITLTVTSKEVYFASLYVEFVTYSYSKTQGEESSLKIILAGLLCTKPWGTKINDTLYPYPWDEDTFHLYPWEAEEVKGSWNQMIAEASKVI